MAAIVIPTLKEIALQDITSVKLVFYPKDITSDNWDDVAEALGDQLDNDGPNVVTMQVDPETSTEDLLQFFYNSKESPYRSNKNHILFFSGDELAAIENLGQDEILLSSINMLRLSVSLENVPINSGTVQSNFLINTESIPNVTLDYNVHTESARNRGMGSYPVEPDTPVHPYIYGSAGKGTEPVLLRTDAADYLKKQELQTPVLTQVEEFVSIRLDDSDSDDDSLLHHVQIKPGSMLFQVNGESRKYLYSIFYYYSRQLILDHVRDCLRLMGIRGNDYELPEEAHLGFNDRSGSYLYLYDLNVLGSGYMLAVLIGSNSNNRIDIYLARNIALQSSYSVDSGLPLQINHWYDRLYFVLPMYDGTGLEKNSLRPLYTVYPDTAHDKSLRPKPITHSVIYTVPDPRNEAKTLSTELQVNYYLPKSDISGEPISSGDSSSDSDSSDEPDTNMDTVMLRIMEDYDHIYMTEFSDIGDVLISADFTGSGVSVKYFNIFGNEAANGTEFSTMLFNTYDFEGRAAEWSPAEDKSTLDLLPGYYLTSGQQLKYLLENGYKPICLNSAYSAGYDAYSRKYLVLFKCDRLSRIRRDIAEPFWFMDDYIRHPDSVEFLNGDPFAGEITDGEQTYQTESASADSFCGITDLSSIIAAARRTIVLSIKDSYGNIIGAYRY